MIKGLPYLGPNTITIKVMSGPAYTYMYIRESPSGATHTSFSFFIEELERMREDEGLVPNNLKVLYQEVWCDEWKVGFLSDDKTFAGGWKIDSLDERSSHSSVTIKRFKVYKDDKNN